MLIERNGHTLELPVTQAQLDEFESGPSTRRLIQDIFPDLTPCERDYIKIGMTPKDSLELFGVGREGKKKCRICPLKKCKYLTETLPLFPEEVVLDPIKMPRKVIGGIYVPKGCDPEDPETEFSIYFGNEAGALHLLFDGMDHIENDVEIGGMQNYDYVDGYCMSVRRHDNEWRVKDTGHHGCKKILARGKCDANSLLKSLEPYLKIFSK